LDPAPAVWWTGTGGEVDDGGGASSAVGRGGKRGIKAHEMPWAGFHGLPERIAHRNVLSLPTGF